MVNGNWVSILSTKNFKRTNEMVESFVWNNGAPLISRSDHTESIQLFESPTPTSSPPATGMPVQQPSLPVDPRRQKTDYPRVSQHFLKLSI